MTKSKRRFELVYFELHVDDKTFYVHGAIEAKDLTEANKKLKSIKGKHYHLQLMGFLGKATKRNMLRWLIDSIPKEALIKD